LRSSRQPLAQRVDGDEVPGPIGGAGDDRGLEDHGTSRLRLPAFKVVPSGL